MKKNNREFFRVHFRGNFDGEILFNRSLSVPIEINNISVGGMSFQTTMEFSMNWNIVCKFSVLDQEFQLDAIVMRKKHVGSQIEYGVAFEINLEMAKQLFMQLNYYEIRKQKGGQ